MPFKTITMLRKRDDLSIAAFRRLYEEQHAVLGERVLRGRALRYVRRYIEPFPGTEEDQAHHVLTEIWFADRAAFDAAMAFLAEPAIAAEIAEDEATLFDRSATRFYSVEECETAF